MNRYNNTVGALLYLSIPIIIFFLTWLKWYWGIFFTSIFIISVIFYLKFLPEQDDSALTLAKSKEGAVAVLCVLLFLLITGHGALLGGTGYDTPWRNAVYQDLIHLSWPVIYQASQGMLVYYLTYWLVPASISFWLNFGFVTSNIVLAIWTYLGLRLFVFLLWDYLKLKSNQLVPATLLFLFWSGLNVVGMIIVSALDKLIFTVDAQWGWFTWWYTGISDGSQIAYMIRTVFDSLGNIYNQFVPLLLVTILFLKYREKVEYSIFLCLLAVPFSPLGAVGICSLGLIFNIKSLFITHHGKIKIYLKRVLSMPNILTLFSIFPVFLFYYATNSAVASKTSIFFAPISAYGITRVSMLLLYYLLQFGVFMFLCYDSIDDKWLFYSILATLMVFPFFRVGTSGDFCWNASIPSFFIVLIFMLQHIKRLFKDNKATVNLFVTGMVIALTVLTPCLQIASQTRKCFEFKRHVVIIDTGSVGGTLANKTKEEIIKGYSNFVSLTYQKKIFNLYFAKQA